MIKFIKSIISVIAVAFLVYIFTFYVDGEMGIILLAFVAFAPLVSLFFMLYARKRVKVAFTCDAYVPKGSTLTVTVNIRKNGAFPFGIIEICPYATEIFGQDIKNRKLTMLSEEKKDSLFMYLTEASRYAVEEFVGQLPPYTKFNNFVYRISQLGLTAVENEHAK